jgi:hypothetical protein
MTDDERLALAERAWMENRHDERAYLLAFARALESRVLAERKEPVAWVRYRSDGGFEGPIMDSDARMCDTRRSFWTPLFAHPTPDDASLEAFKGTLAALAAAISLLDRGSKKAAASDRMFDAMLSDYRKALDAGRAAIDRARQSGEEGND